jgi:D-alanine-D-alanine ligase
MEIGLTYDLRDEYLLLGYGEEETAEFDRGDTIEAIERTLQSLGYRTDRIGSARELARRLVAGDRWDMVFNIAEGLNGYGREALVPALLDDYGVAYTFSDPLVLSLTLHKAMAKHVVRDAGMPTPAFRVVEKAQDAAGIDLPYPLFLKPVAEGTGKGITAASKVMNEAQAAVQCKRMLTTYRQPVLAETYLPGREFTVGIVGTGDRAVSIGVLEVILKDNAEPEAYSYLNKEKCEELVEYRLADDPQAKAAARIALKSYRALGCADAGRVDLRADEYGVPNFIEVNPLAGLHPEHSDLCIVAEKAGLTYRGLIGAIMESAMEKNSFKKRMWNQHENRRRLQPSRGAGIRQLGSLR